MKRLQKRAGWAVVVAILVGSPEMGQVPWAPLPLAAAGNGDEVSELLIIPNDTPLPPPPDSAPSPDTLTPESIGMSSIVAGDLLNPADDKAPYDYLTTYDLPDKFPVAFESSGTWLRRGFWYVEADAVLYDRNFDRRDILMAVDTTAPFIGTVDPIAQRQIIVVSANRSMRIRKAKPAEGMPKITIGRFLFRDAKNRDHSAEFTAFGGGQWFEQGSIESVTPNALHVPVALDLSSFIFNVSPLRQQSFDFSTAQSFDYGSRFNSFEVNYRLRSRMRKDQMVLQPDGQWVRRGSPTSTWGWLAGLRFFDLTELLNWSARDVLVDGNNEQGHMRVETDNDMFGMQLGFEATMERPRWSLGLTAKGGPYLNAATIDVDAIITGNALDINIRSEENVLAFVGEFGILGKFHLRPNLSARVGYNIMYVEAAAIAPFNITFDPNATQRGTSAGLFYHGAAFGVEGYW